MAVEKEFTFVFVGRLDEVTIFFIGVSLLATKLVSYYKVSSSTSTSSSE